MEIVVAHAEITCNDDYEYQENRLHQNFNSHLINDCEKYKSNANRGRD